MSDTYTAYEHANRNQAEIESSSTCACYGCYASFAASEVTRFTHTTAWCPRCEAWATVMGDASGLPLERDFLEAVHDHWIGPQEWLDEQAERTHLIAKALYEKPDSPPAAPAKTRPWWRLW
ncbi:hypothetical protein ACMGT0_20505 [Pseudomonas sp. RHF3.3-3]|uniref:hypothetical protein n=1 Tax=Pseudomonas sp. RHF3.3-3 TaxID=3396624 RepID=UPI003A84E1ED